MELTRSVNNVRSLLGLQRARHQLYISCTRFASLCIIRSSFCDKGANALCFPEKYDVINLKNHNHTLAGSNTLCKVIHKIGNVVWKSNSKSDLVEENNLSVFWFAEIKIVRRNLIQNFPSFASWKTQLFQLCNQSCSEDDQTRVTPFYTTVWHRVSYWRICLDRQWVSWIVSSPRVDNLGYSWANLFFPVFLGYTFKVLFVSIEPTLQVLRGWNTSSSYLNDEQFCSENDTFMIFWKLLKLFEHLLERPLFSWWNRGSSRCDFPCSSRTLTTLRAVFSAFDAS